MAKWVTIDERDERDRELIKGLVDFMASASVALRLLPPSTAANAIACRLVAIRREWHEHGVGQLVDEREAFIAPRLEVELRELFGESDEPSTMATLAERTWSRGAE
jgi:hypothetical protein